MAVLGKYLVILLTMSICFSFATNAQDFSPSEIWNGAHLEHLRESVEVNGEECLNIRIYSEAPDYHFVVDDDEGSACVDDVARAVRLYMERYTLTNDDKYLKHAKGLLKYVLNMQAEDGRFYNFIWPDGTINKEHENSVVSLGWWAARSFRALCISYRYWPNSDVEFKSRIKNAIDATIKAIENDESFLDDESYDRYAVWLLAFTDLKKIDITNTDNNQIIQSLGQTLINGKHYPNAIFPYTIHFSWKNIWHGWAALQVEALARAGEVMDNQEWIDSAIEEANQFHRFILLKGMLSYVAIHPDSIEIHELSQIAYATNSLMQSQVAIFEVTNDSTYLEQAGLLSSWFNGNNIAGYAMYDNISGRGYDGISSSDFVNMNSGAESTIEALLAIHLLEKYPSMIDQYLSKITFKENDHTVYESRNFKYSFELVNERIEYKKKVKRIKTW